MALVTRLADLNMEDLAVWGTTRNPQYAQLVYKEKPLLIQLDGASAPYGITASKKFPNRYDLALQPSTADQEMLAKLDNLVWGILAGKRTEPLNWTSMMQNGESPANGPVTIRAKVMNRGTPEQQSFTPVFQDSDRQQLPGTKAAIKPGSELQVIIALDTIHFKDPGSARVLCRLERARVSREGSTGAIECDFLD